MHLEAPKVWLPFFSCQSLLLGTTIPNDNSDVNTVRTVIVSDIFIGLHLNDVMYRKSMKKDTLCRFLVSCDQINTCTKLLDIDHKFMNSLVI